MCSRRNWTSGLAIVAVLAVAADWTSGRLGAPPYLTALLLGAMLSSGGDVPAWQPGLRFASRSLVQVGVALIGLRVDLHLVSTLPLTMLLSCLSGILLTLVVGRVFVQLSGGSRQLGTLTGAAVGICGGSAAVAIAAVLRPWPDRERDLSVTLASVALFSAGAMVLYPWVGRLFELSETELGLLIGASIHDVAQVAGAGYSVSPTTGDTAVLVKLYRVS